MSSSYGRNHFMVNVIDIKPLDAFLASFASGSNDPRVEAFLIYALKKPLLKEERLYYIVTSYPDNPPEWLTPKKFMEDSFHRLNLESVCPNIRAKIEHVKDWIVSAINDNDEWVNDLDRQGRPKRFNFATLKDAVSAADKDMKKKSARLREKFADSVAAFEEQLTNGHIKIIKDLERGYKFVQLLTPEALDFESVKIRHCIGNGAYDARVKDKNYQYYSLRDGSNKPHATIEINNKNLVQCKGKGNKPPIADYFAFIQEFIKENQWTLSASPRSTGLIKYEGEYYTANDLPEGMRYPGMLNLSHIPWLTRLPNNLSVSRGLGLTGCTSLTALPDNLTVAGPIMYLNECPSLRSIGKNLKVAGSIFYDRIQFKTVEEFQKYFEEKYPPPPAPSITSSIADGMDQNPEP